ncbi:MAG TPA: hypothetical protein VHD36_08975 [Pirellulales bacterium]|nr:hypothetical protein [Pirellulales bacterium]
MTDSHPEPRPAAAGTFENLGRKLDERPEVRAAEKALRAAQEQLERALSQYQDVRHQAAENFAEARRSNSGDWLSAVLEMVRKYPAPGVLLALACGWLCGRIFRR